MEFTATELFDIIARASDKEVRALLSHIAVNEPAAFARVALAAKRNA
jgi:ribosomal protein L20